MTACSPSPRPPGERWRGAGPAGSRGGEGEQRGRDAGLEWWLGQVPLRRGEQAWQEGEQTGRWLLPGWSRTGWKVEPRNRGELIRNRRKTPTTKEAQEGTASRQKVSGVFIAAFKMQRTVRRAEFFQP